MRLALIVTAILVHLVAASTTAVRAEPGKLVVLVRHAEKAESGDRDPPLSPAGEARALALADALTDTRIDAIITTQFERTRGTAAPIANARGLVPIEAEATRDLDRHITDVARIVQSRPAGEAILVVGHSNTVPRIIAALGGPEIPQMAESDHSTMFILHLPRDAKPRLVRAHYGEPDRHSDLER